MPKRTPYVSQRADGFQYQRWVPGKLQPIIELKVWTHWLGNDGRAAAEQKARELAVKHDRLIAGLSGLTDAERQQIAAAGGWEAWQAGVRNPDVKIAFNRIFADRLKVDPKAPEAEQAETALRVLRARDRAVTLEAEAAAAKRLARKIDGETAGSLPGLVPLWQRIAKPRAAKSIDKANMHVRRFVEMVGDFAPREVTRQHAIAYRDALEKLPELSADSIDKHLYGMHRLFAVALSEGVVGFNPFSGVKARKGDNGKFADQGRKPFSSTHARLIFKRLAELPADDQMVMRLLAYHGMRAGEVCQLRACDVMRVSGVDVMSINDVAGSIKNRASLREVPLHPKCRDLLKLAKSKATDAYLFDYPMWKHSRAGKFQQRAGAWLRKIGITDPKLMVHSWRHTWRTLARELNMPEPISRAILGHTLGSGDHGKYGEAPSLKLRAKAIAKIEPLI